MRKSILALGLAALVLVPTQRAQALIGVGLNVGRDGYSIAGTTYSGLFGVSGLEFTRNDMESPLGIGAYLFIDLIPVVDLDIGADLYLNTFDVSYDNPVTGQTLSEKFGWARTNMYFTVQRKLFKVPMFNLFAGGGLSFHAAVPLLDNTFIEEFLGSSSETFDVAKLEDEIITKTGVHFELGARFKPLLVPFAVNVKYRLSLVDGIAPGESSFSTLSLGFGFQL